MDSAAVVVIGPLRLHDGLDPGLGSENAISTGRLHVLGPVGLGSLLGRSLVVRVCGTGPLPHRWHEREEDRRRPVRTTA